MQLGDLVEIKRRKTSTSIIWFTIILSIFLSIFIIISLTYQFYQHKTYFGYIGKEDEYYVALYLDDYSIMDIKNGVLKLEDELFDYETFEISDEYYLINSEPKRLIKLFGNINQKHLTINNVVKLELKYNKTTIFKLIKKGMNLWN